MKRKRRFGGKPSAGRLYREMNKKVAAPKKQASFVIVAWVLQKEDFQLLMRRKLDIREELYPVLRSVLTDRDPKYVRASLGHHRPSPNKVAFYVERRDNKWQTPQLRCVCPERKWIHYDQPS